MRRCSPASALEPLEPYATPARSLRAYAPPAQSLRAYAPHAPRVSAHIPRLRAHTPRLPPWRARIHIRGRVLSVRSRTRRFTLSRAWQILKPFWADLRRSAPFWGGQPHPAARTSDLGPPASYLQRELWGLLLGRNHQEAGGNTRKHLSSFKKNTAGERNVLFAV